MTLTTTAGLVVRLARANMTVISAVTFLSASIMSTSASFPPTNVPFSLATFLRTWVFVLLTQFMTHFFGEIHDLHSDRLNIHSTPMTGGSKVLVHRKLSTSFAYRLSFLTLALNILYVFIALPSFTLCRSVALLMVFLAYSYSAPPLQLNFHCLGELDAALVTSILLPLFALLSQHQHTSARYYMALVSNHVALQLLIVPPFIAKLNVFLFLNLIDKAPDWAAHKRTLPVALGQRRAIHIHSALMAATYVSCVAIIARATITTGTHHIVAFAFVLPPAFIALKLTRAMHARRNSYDTNFNHLLPLALIHSTALVWAVLLYALLLSVPQRGLVQPYTPFIAVFAFLSFRNFLRRGNKAGPKPPALDLDVDVDQQQRTAPQTDVESQQPLTHHQQHQHQSRAMNDDDEGGVTHDVIVVGGGIAGTVAALTLHAQGRDVKLLEKRPRDACGTGADLALWPGAIHILKRLGVPADFFRAHCYALHRVHMCNMTFSSDEEEGTHNGDEESIALASAPRAEVLKVIDMDKVTADTGEHMVLVSRPVLMAQLLRLLPPSVATYGVSVRRIDDDGEEGRANVSYTMQHGEGDDSVQVDATCRVVVGADGARSMARKLVHPGTEGELGVQYRGEVCYRGVLDASETVTQQLMQDAEDGVMRINYGAGVRSSFGYMDGERRSVYWWVKERQRDQPIDMHKVVSEKLHNCPWPSPLKDLLAATPPRSVYAHAIEDAAAELRRWSGSRCALVGDAAHLVTPNMGQGACMAVEDSFVLATLLCKYWNEEGEGEGERPLEAFYQYEAARRPFAEGVAADARKQLAMAQWSSPWLLWVRECVLRYVPAWVLEKTLKKNNFDATPFMSLFDDQQTRRLDVGVEE